MFETEIVSNFQRLSNSADFNKMSTKENKENLEIHENASAFQVIQSY